MNLENLANALRIASYKRIALQVDDSQLHMASQWVEYLQSRLPGSIVSLLGDSVTRCCLDEVSAEHYGSDCIVKIGHTCWFASQRMVAYFVPHCELNTEEVRRRFDAARAVASGPIVLFVDTIDEALSILTIPHSDRGVVYVAVSICMSFPGSEFHGDILWRPFVSMGMRSMFGRRVIPTVAGRLLYECCENGSLKQIVDQRIVDEVLKSEETCFVVTGTEDGLNRRLTDRFGSRPGRVFSLSDSSNYGELMRRYRGVEAVKMAATVGIVVTHCSASKELFQVRDLLSVFLRAMNKEVHMFSVGKVDGVKLGNFPDVKVFVILACPESYWAPTDLAAECVGPFEALVAVEALDWSDHIVTDYDEMLATMVTEPPPRTPRTPRGRRRPTPVLGQLFAEKIAPAKIEMGLRGIPSRYVSEPNR